LYVFFRDSRIIIIIIIMSKGKQDEKDWSKMPEIRNAYNSFANKNDGIGPHGILHEDRTATLM
jgi:hypothetical protein